MGNDCDIPKPNEVNVCSNIGDININDNFCTPNGLYGEERREEHCAAMSSAGEWVFNSKEGSCWWDNCDMVSKRDGGSCCGTCCGFPDGRKASCRRVGTYGAPLVCCFRDQQCNGPESCFDTTQPNPPRTCDATNRDMSSKECRSLVMDYCLGINDAKSDFPDWKHRWLDDNVTITRPANDAAQTPVSITLDQPCYHALYRNLYARYDSTGVVSREACLGSPGIGIPATAGIAWSKELMTRMMAKYESEGFTIDAAEGETTDPRMNSMIWDICSQTPGLCQDYLKVHCSSFTPEGILKHPSSFKWCGCYMSPDVYAKYTDLYQIPVECTPTCNQTGNLPLAEINGVTPKRCTQSICVMDNITIDIINTDIKNFNFEQVCSSCGSKGSCQCTLSNFTFISGGSQIDKLDLSQKCGSSTCYRDITNTEGVVTKTIQVPCDSDDSYDPQAIDDENKKKLQQANNTLVMYIIIIFIILIVILIVGWFIIVPRKRKEYTVSSNADLNRIYAKPPPIKFE